MGGTLVLVAGILLIATNLRAITALAPLPSGLRLNFDLSASEASFGTASERY
jgi:cyanate permease